MDFLSMAEKPVYPTTIWSDVQRAEDSITALERLLQKYYRPLQTHLECKFRVGPDQSADWMQEFIRRKVILGELLAKASRDRGRFRTFLLNALDNFVLSELRRQNAGIRQPSGGQVAFEELGQDVAAKIPGPQTDHFAVEWARTVVAETVARLEAECQAKGRFDRLGVFKARLLDPILEGARAPSYGERSARFQYRTGYCAC